MTVLIAGRHAWMPAFCTACEQIVHFQKEDVLKGFVPVGSDPHIGQVLHYIVCKCSNRIEIARR